MLKIIKEEREELLSRIFAFADRISNNRARARFSLAVIQLIRDLDRRGSSRRHHLFK